MDGMLNGIYSTNIRETFPRRENVVGVIVKREGMTKVYDTSSLARNIVRNLDIM